MASLLISSSEKIAIKLQILSRKSLDDLGFSFDPKEIEQLQKIAQDHFTTVSKLPDISCSRPIYMNRAKKLAIMQLSDQQDLVLGTGLDKTVYYGVDLVSGKTYAIAQISPDLRQYTKNECSIMNFLKSIPNIVHLHAAITTPQKDLMIMEPFSSDNLAKRISDRSLDPSEKMQIAQDTIQALGQIHATGVVHRDIKPRNIFLSLDPTTGKVARAVIGDFGFATKTDNQTRMVQMDGYPQYLSPEKVAAVLQYKNGPTKAEQMWSDAAKPGDVWALGATLFELFTEKPLVPGKTTDLFYEQIRKLTQAEIDARIQEISPPDIQPALLEMLQIDLAKRSPAAQAASV